jgi:hypothetical protein
MDAKDALPFGMTLMEAGADYGITPVGILAMDMARVEAGCSCSMWITPPRATPGSSRRSRRRSSWDSTGRWRSISPAISSVAARWNERSAKARPGRWWGWKWIGWGWKISSRGWLAAADPRHGGAGKSADAGWQRAGWICIHIHLVAAVEEVHRAGTFAEAVLRRSARMYEWKITVEHHRQHAPAKVVKLAVL